MQGQGQSHGSPERVAHAGLLCVYTLAALLSVLLPASLDARAASTRASGRASLALDAAAGDTRSLHHEAGTAPPAHAAPGAPPRLDAPLLLEGPAAALSAAAPVVSSPSRVPPSRGPPSLRAV